MTKRLLVILVLWMNLGYSQIDFSSSWEDFFSYNNVKDFVKVDQRIYALVDNAVFTYDLSTETVRKISSVQGLSGETTTAIHFSKSTNRLVIGYENGLIEVVDNNGRITISADIVNFNQSGEKQINHIYEHNGLLYLSTSFAIVEYDINRLEFGDTFFIGNNSSDIKINQTVVFNNTIYAATEQGVFTANVTNNSLIDFNNWNQQLVGTNYNNIVVFNNKIFISSGTRLYEFDGMNQTQVRSFSGAINELTSTTSYLSVALTKSFFILNTELSIVIQHTAIDPFNYDLNSVFAENNQLFLGTSQFGLLLSTFSDVGNFREVHPEGPVSNDVFSVAAQNNHLWVTYGGYALTVLAPLQRRLGYSHFNGTSWFTPANNPVNPFPDFVGITLDPDNANRAFISSFGDTRNFLNTINTGGLMEVDNNVQLNFYNNLNSPLEDIESSDPNRTTVRLPGSAFDSQKNLWVANIAGRNELKKLSSGGSWSGFDISGAKFQNSFGLTDIAVDRTNNVWIATRGDGAIVFNEQGNRLTSLTTTQTQGSLPNQIVLSLAVDRDNRIWIGTLAGLVVFNNASGVFDAETRDASPVIIIDDGVPRRLLGEQIVSTIAVDGANNKWFGTDNGGVVYTNPSGQTTIATFNKENSPLPSNRITKIAVDTTNGKVFFATDKGIVAYNSNVSPFGTSLGEVYAYPNPVRKFHNTVTIDGRNGTNLPRGTNVKIVDIAGNLVYETNVVEGQQLQGGKVVWDKTNLAGRKVASGVYIVMLTNEDATETSTTKIAIIN